jgi:hypothetical protein
MKFIAVTECRRGEVLKVQRRGEAAYVPMWLGTLACGCLFSKFAGSTPPAVMRCSRHPDGAPAKGVAT